MARRKGLEDNRAPTAGGRINGAGGRSAAAAGARRPGWRVPRFDLAGLSLARRYLLLSLVFVVVGGGIVAYALGQLIETSAINRTTSVTALYVESFVAPELQSLATGPSLSQSEIDSLQRLLSDSSLEPEDRLVPDLVHRRPDPVQPAPGSHRAAVRHERGARPGGAGCGHRGHQRPERPRERLRARALGPPHRDLPAGSRQRLVPDHRGGRVLPAPRRAGGRGQQGPPDRLGAGGRSDGPGLPGPRPRRSPGQRDDRPPGGRAPRSGSASSRPCSTRTRA